MADEDSATPGHLRGVKYVRGLVFCSAPVEATASYNITKITDKPDGWEIWFQKDFKNG